MIMFRVAFLVNVRVRIRVPDRVRVIISYMLWFWLPS